MLFALQCREFFALSCFVKQRTLIINVEGAMHQWFKVDNARGSDGMLTVYQNSLLDPWTVTVQHIIENETSQNVIFGRMN